ncbi:unnamed protein product [Durusdinium trenchii]|uniref:Rhodanese domain-containing protein n=1 Tax=Durusdinium trenchii TaxID=1381693 RepID=A0ABP0NNQ8_9DINO
MSSSPWIALHSWFILVVLSSFSSSICIYTHIYIIIIWVLSCFNLLQLLDLSEAPSPAFPSLIHQAVIADIRHHRTHGPMVARQARHFLLPGTVDSSNNYDCDYLLTHWPQGTSIKDGSAALAVDKVNDQLADWDHLLTRRRDFREVLSFSHFLPRVENNPEKRYLTHPNLAKGIGSQYLRKRVDDLRPNVHVFGHTHFGYDLEVDGVRYVQAPLSMSSERHSRGTTVALGDFPDGLPFSHPFMVWHSRTGWAPKSQGAWSAYVERYGRRPDVTWLIPSYVADGLEPAPSAGITPKVGWLPGRMPVWLFGPKSQRIQEAAAESRKISERLAKEAAGTYRRNKNHAPGTEEPLPIEASEVGILLCKGNIAVIDVREGECFSRPANCIELPHPSKTNHFAALPDDELLDLGERIMAGEGPRILVGDPDAPASCRHAALLLAALLRLWPRDVRPLRGGFKAWQAQGLPVTKVAREPIDVW